MSGIMVSMRKDAFAPGEYYHIYNRVIFNMAEFESHKNAERLNRSFLLANSMMSGTAFDFLRDNKNNIEQAVKIAKTGEKLVDVICYAIMPDHYHLLVKEIKEGGIINFVHKCNISISKYINISQDRKGPLFESRFKSKHVVDNKYLVHLSAYIHLNPLDIISGKEWRKHKLKNWASVKNRLLNYNWSSLTSFLDSSCRNEIISGQEIILDQFDNGKDYENYLKDWSEEYMDGIDNIIME